MKVAFAVFLGWFVLLPACLLRAWTYPPAQHSLKPWPSGTENVGPYRPVADCWKWNWLNAWYDNVEDGVSGQQAWIWHPTGLSWYPSGFAAWMPKWAIAYAWSGWRNSANNLKRQ